MGGFYIKTHLIEEQKEKLRRFKIKERDGMCKKKFEKQFQKCIILSNNEFQRKNEVKKRLLKKLEQRNKK